MSKFTAFSHFAETLLGQLLPLVGTLAAANNPAYTPIIQIAQNAAITELNHIASGGTPSPSDNAVGALAASAVALAAQKAANNSGDAAHQAIIQAAAPIVENGIVTALGTITSTSGVGTSIPTPAAPTPAPSA